MENRFAFNITPEEKIKILKTVNELATMLKPYLIALDKRDKQLLAKMSDRSIPFVEKSLQYMTADAQFVPSYLDVPEAAEDFEAFQDLREILRPIEQIADNLDDTTTLAGSEAWQASLTYYNAVKAASKAGVLDAKTIYDDLKIRFEEQRAKPKPPTP